jgi:hypothetical protein
MMMMIATTARAPKMPQMTAGERPRAGGFSAEAATGSPRPPATRPSSPLPAPRSPAVLPFKAPLRPARSTPHSGQYLASPAS